MSLIDLFKEFHRDAIQQEFPPSARVLYDTLLYKFNEAFWIDKLVLSERDLTQLTGLSPASVHRAKHFLASRQIIKCTPFKNKTSYSLGEAVMKQLRSSNEAVMKQSWSSREAVGGSSYIRVREDVKTLDVKTSPLPTDTTARVCAPVNRNSEEADLDAIVDRWQELRFGRLNIEMVSELELLLKKHGFDKINRAMTEAAESNGKSQGVSFKFFKAVLENTGKPTQKAGEKRAKQQGFITYKPDPDIVYPWELGGTDSEVESSARGNKTASA